MSGNYKKWLDRINAKQDTLTEDNVGEFMDLEYAHTTMFVQVHARF
jgi:hypothetical protein